MKKPQKKDNPPRLSLTKKTIEIMTSLTQNQATEDKATAKFDVALSLPPAETSLDSEYFQAYLNWSLD